MITWYRATAPVLEKRLEPLPASRSWLKVGLGDDEGCAPSRAAPLAVPCSVSCSRRVSVNPTPPETLVCYMSRKTRLRYRPQNRFCEERHNWPFSFSRNQNLMTGLPTARCFSSTIVRARGPPSKCISLFFPYSGTVACTRPRGASQVLRAGATRTPASHATLSRLVV